MLETNLTHMNSADNVNALIGALDSLREVIPSATLALIDSEIDAKVTAFLDQALQLDEKSVLNELKAEAIGAL